MNSKLSRVGGELKTIKGWWQASEGTPDYFNVCSSKAGVPQNIFGTQDAISEHKTQKKEMLMQDSFYLVMPVLLLIESICRQNYHDLS